MKLKINLCLSLFLYLQLTTSLKNAGIVDKIDNMEELGKPNKIEIYQDMRVDKKVHDLK